jgi:hypothetical protein
VLSKKKKKSPGTTLPLLLTVVGWNKNNVQMAAHSAFPEHL